MRGNFLVEVLNDGSGPVCSAEREIGAGPVVMETKGSVLVEGAPPAGVEKGLGQFPELGLEYVQAVPGEVEHFPVEHGRFGVFGDEALLELFITFRQFALGATFSRLGFCNQLSS